MNEQPETQVLTEAPPIPATAYFKKVLASTALVVGNQAVKFTMLANNIGVIAVPVGSELELALTKLAQANNGQGRGGVIAIDEAGFHDLKKNLPLVPSFLKSKPKLQVFNQFPQKPKPKPVAVAPVAAVEKISGGVGFPDGVVVADDAASASSAPVLLPAGVTTVKKSYRFPVTKKTTSRSLEGGVPEPEPKED